MNKGRKSSNFVKSNEWHCTCAICAQVLKVTTEKIILLQYVYEFLKLLLWKMFPEGLYQLICNSSRSCGYVILG